MRWGWLVLLGGVLGACAAGAQPLVNQNPGHLPSFVRSGSGAWTVGHCAVVDSTGRKLEVASCPSASGDISDVWSCSAGNCNALTAAAGDTLDAGSADASKPCKRGTALPGTCAEGECFHNTIGGGLEFYVCTAANTWTKGMTAADIDTAAELRLIMSGETTGIGDLVFGNSPTLTTPSIASFQLAQHTHQNAAGGGTLSAAAIGSGTLPLARGGTGQTSWTAGECVRVNAGGTALESAGAACGTGGGGGAPTDATYVTLSAHGGLSAERVLTAGPGIDVSDGGSTAVIDWDSTELNDFIWGDGTDATIQRTYNVSTGTDPVIQFSNGTVNVSTGTLQQGGTPVVLQTRTITAGDGLTGGGDLSANRSLGIDTGATLSWTGLSSYASGTLVLPQGTSCPSSVEGVVCWDTDDDTLSVGTGSARRVLVDTTRTISTTSPLAGGGALSGNLTLSITANGIGPTQIDETASYTWVSGTHSFASAGMVLPQHASNCGIAIAEGQVCWDTDDNVLSVGDGAGRKVFLTNTADSIDATLINEADDYAWTGEQDMSGAVLLLPQHASSCGFAVLEGWPCWDTDDDTLSVGTGAARKQVILSGTDNAISTPLQLTTADNTVSLILSDVATNTTTKEARIGLKHYTNSEEPVALIHGEATSSASVVRIGGGTSQMNAATQLSFFTAANRTTVTGNEVGRVNGATWKLGADMDTPNAALHVEAAAVESAVLRLESTATNDDVRRTVVQQRIATTSATPALAAITTTTTNRIYEVACRFVARRTGGSSGSGAVGDGASYWRRATWKGGGTATLIGSVQTIGTDAEADAAWDATLVESSGVLAVQVTGAADTNITWHSTCEYSDVGS